MSKVYCFSKRSHSPRLLLRYSQFILSKYNKCRAIFLFPILLIRIGLVWLIWFNSSEFDSVDSKLIHLIQFSRIWFSSFEFDSLDSNWLIDSVRSNWFVPFIWIWLSWYLEMKQFCLLFKLDIYRTVGFIEVTIKPNLTYSTLIKSNKPKPYPA